MRNWISYASSSNWLRVVGVATIVLLGCYLMVQQAIRLGANQLPLATAQTAKHELESGKRPMEVIPTIKTDLKNDSTVFVIVTDSSYRAVASSAELDGNSTTPPAGTFSTALHKGSNWFTWQPEQGVRLATEILPYSYKTDSGFVVAGQSLSSPEGLTNHISWITLAAWLGVVVWATFIPLPYASNKSK